MLRRLLVPAFTPVLLSAVLLTAQPAEAVPPDPEFTASMDAYIEAKRLEFLDRIAAQGRVPTEAEIENAWCRAVNWWKMANPDGEQKLTLDGLIRLRQLEVECGLRMRRALPLPDEPQRPVRTLFEPPDGAGDPVDTNKGGEDDMDGTRQAHEDYIRWHPDEYRDATNEQDYIEEGLDRWWIIGEGAELWKLIENPVGVSGGGAELSGEEHRYNGARAAEADRLRQEFRAANPDAPAAPPPRPPGPPPGYVEDEWRGGYVPAGPPPGYVEDEWRGGYIPGPNWNPAAEPAPDSWDRLQNWYRLREPVEVGSNDDVGTGARRRGQVAGAAEGVLRNALGLGGGSRRGRDDGPRVSRCRVRDRDMTEFANASGDTRLDLLGRCDRNEVTIFANINDAPDSGTFQAAVLQDQYGRVMQPSDVRICDLYGEWRLTVSWIRTTYRNGRQTSQESGGWSETGLFSVGEDGEATGLWRQLGFSGASHGANEIAITFDLPPDALRQNGAVLILHTTRPGEDPVMTTPFALMLEEVGERMELATGP